MQVQGARNPRCKLCFLSPFTFRVNWQACLTTNGALGFSDTTLTGFEALNARNAAHKTAFILGEKRSTARQ